MTQVITGLARSRALAGRVPRYEFGICMHSWSPPQAALNIASLTEDCTDAPHFPQKFNTRTIGVMRAGRSARTKCIGAMTTSTMFEQTNLTWR